MIFTRLPRLLSRLLPRLWRSEVRLHLMVLALALFVGLACQGPVPGIGDIGSSPKMDLQPGWNVVEPGGETRCSDGTPYKFWVRPGNPKKLMFYLEGGGACWTRESCDPNLQPTYTQNLATTNPNRQSGIFDYTNATNPLAYYTTVFVPYCSADVHLGAKDTVYAPLNDDQAPLTIYHRGLKNAGAALAWTYANVSSPRTAFVTGSSAGAIPAPYYAMKIAEHYPRARVVQLGDGAGGYTQDGTLTLPYAQWGSVDILRGEPAFADLQDESFSAEEMYVRAAQQQPRVVFARYDTAEDGVQRRFLGMMGDVEGGLMPRLESSRETIGRALGENFHSYIAGGDSYTILRRPTFYQFSAAGQSIRDWVAGLVAGDRLTDAHCSDCRLPDYVGAPTSPALRDLWLSWESEAQRVEPFQIFDNLYYVGIDWVAAYVLKTDDGLILIDGLYGKWVNHLYANMRKLGLNPADIKYVIATHGHFDHAAGAADVQRQFGARVVMSAEDWQLAEAPAEHPLFAMTPPKRDPKRDIVAADGDVVRLGNTHVHLYKTPGHTQGVLSLVYEVHDGDASYHAMTLGGVGLNFSGIERTQSYIESYTRLQELAVEKEIEVTLPNHASMGAVFERRDALLQRQPGDAHPFVDAAAFNSDLARFLAAAQEKLVAEKAGTAKNPMAELIKILDD